MMQMVMLAVKIAMMGTLNLAKQRVKTMIIRPNATKRAKTDTISIPAQKPARLDTTVNLAQHSPTVALLSKVSQTGPLGATKPVLTVETLDPAARPVVILETTALSLAKYSKTVVLTQTRATVPLGAAQPAMTLETLHLAKNPARCTEMKPLAAKPVVSMGTHAFAEYSKTAACTNTRATVPLGAAQPAMAAETLHLAENPARSEMKPLAANPVLFMGTNPLAQNPARRTEMKPLAAKPVLFMGTNPLAQNPAGCGTEMKPLAAKPVVMGTHALAKYSKTAACTKTGATVPLGVAQPAITVTMLNLAQHPARCTDMNPLAAKPVVIMKTHPLAKYSKTAAITTGNTRTAMPLGAAQPATTVTMLTLA